MFKSLYQYQLEDVEKFKDNLYSLDGSDMGVGKTHTAIELMRLWRGRVEEKTGKRYPILIVTPINTFPSWVEKIKEQAPELSVLVIDRKNRDVFIDAILWSTHDVYIMHWQAVALVVQKFVENAVRFSVVIGDEAHALSNRKTNVVKAFKKISWYHVHLMSGTASGDKPWNLWSLLNIMDRKAFSSYWKFIDAFVREEYEYRGTSKYRKFVGVKNLDKLHAIMDEFYTRHMKAEPCCEHHPQGVMPWLPKKIYERITVELNPSQRRIYNEMHNQMVAWVNENEDTPLIASVVIAKLTRLSQIALATPEIDEFGIVNLSMPSSKYNAVKEIITDYEDKSFILFTSSKKFAYLVSEQLDADGISNKVLSGSTKAAERDSFANDFVAKKFRIMIAVIDAAAEGIDGLQKVCDTAIFMDRSWKTVKNKQAEDRLYRGGQDKPVTIIDIVAENTIDEYRLDSLDKKWSAIKEILNVRGQI